MKIFNTKFCWFCCLILFWNCWKCKHFFPYENQCECYKNLASRSWPMLFTLNYFFLYIHSPYLLENKKLLWSSVFLSKLDYRPLFNYIYYEVSRQLPPRKITPRLGLGFGLGLVLRSGTVFLGSNCSWIILHNYHSVRVAFNIINKCHTLPAPC